jgi:hypothetical protein
MPISLTSSALSPLRSISPQIELLATFSGTTSAVVRPAIAVAICAEQFSLAFLQWIDGSRRLIRPAVPIARAPYLLPILVWDTETVPDLKGFAAANGHDSKSATTKSEPSWARSFPSTSTIRSFVSAL